MTLRSLLVLLVLCLPTLARAESLTLLDSSNNPVVQFSLPQLPEVTDSLNGEYFTTYGSSDDYGTIFAGFGSPDYELQFYLFGSFGFDYFYGPQLYTGEEGAPTVVDGSYSLSSWEGLSYTLTIDSGAAVTPEPASGLLCVTGGILLCCAWFFRRPQAVRGHPAEVLG